MQQYLHEKIAKYIGFPMHDCIKHTRRVKTLALLRESQFWDEQRIYDYRLAKLQTLVSFAYLNSPYYGAIFKSIKLKPTDIKKLEDIEKIPILTKEILRKQNLELVVKHYNPRYVIKGKTGGTTGVPVIMYKDSNTRSFSGASRFRWYEWLGLDYYSRTVTLWGAKIVTKKSIPTKSYRRFVDFSQNALTINAFQMNDQHMESIYKIIEQFNPKMIKGYLSALLRLSNYIDSCSYSKISPLAISSTTETLLSHNRIKLEKTFKAPVYDQYGCGEVSAVGFECRYQNGMHINQEHVIIEILNDNGVAKSGQRGRIVGTDLDNYVMPIIRYETGDLARIKDTICSCGINQPLLGSVDGRTTDTVILADGSPVHGVFLTDVLYELNILCDKVQRFQAIQNEPGEIEIKLEVTSCMNREQVTLLNKTLLRYFKAVEIRQVKEIEPEQSGKYRYVKGLSGK